MDWIQLGAFVVAVLGLLLAGLAYVTRMLNRLEDRINRRFDDVNDRFDRMDDRFDRMDDRFDRMDDRFDRMDERMARFELRLGDVEHSQVRVDERLDNATKQRTAINSEVKSLNENVQTLGFEQARMLGFLEGRGVMGKAPPEPEAAP